MNIFVPLIVLACTVAPLFAAETPPLVATSAISSVTVFPDRALINRSATVKLTPGRQQVMFDGLPLSLQDDSVRVTGKGSAGAKVVDVSVRRQYLEKPFGEKLQQLTDRKIAAEDGLRTITGRLGTLASQQAFYESIRVGYGERLSKELLTVRPGTAEMAEFARFVGEGLLTVDGKVQEAEREKRELTARIDALNREINQLRGSGAKESRSVVVELEATKAGDTILDLTYLTPGASWEPLYDLRLASDGKAVELTFRAQVRQATGEEWRQVPLTLSTARPAAGGAPTELFPWHVGFYRPQPVYPAAAPMGRILSAKQEAKRMNMDMAEIAAPAEEERVTQFTAAVENSRSATQFRLPKEVSIPTDGSPQGVTVATATLPATVTYHATPKRSAYAYVKAPVINNLGYALLPGRANVFNGDTFSGTSQLKEMAQGEAIDLFFGVDEGIKVKRQELKQHREAGFISGNRQSYSYRIEVTNHKQGAQNITVQDQLPLADDESIKVTLAEASSKPELNATTGVMTWNLALAPGEKQSISFTIQVEYPKDRDIRGL